MKSKKLILVALTLVAVNNVAIAQDRLKASCYINKDNELIGKNPNGLVPIASLSKLLTTHWAAAKLGPEARITTKVNVTPVSAGVVDVHFTGDLDPSFNSNRFASILGQLAKMGVKEIREMSFDEKFRYRASIYGSDGWIWSNPTGTIAKNGSITPLLRASVKSMSSFYKNFLKTAAKALKKDELANSVNIKVTNIDYLNSADFKPTESTQVYDSQSIEIFRILKRMNNVSNNYLANIMFEHLGGAEQYSKFIKERLNFGSENLQILNGSGYPVFVDSDKVYNKATCRALTAISRDLRLIMASKDMRFADVVTVAGRDSESLLGFYTNETTNGSMIAKTGTADPVVSLAGIASTQDGLVYFAVVVADGTPSKALSGRTIIRDEVRKIYKANGGSKKLDYQEEERFEIDNAALLKKEIAIILNLQ